MSDTTGCLGLLHLVKGGGMAVRDAVARLPGSYTGPRYFDRQQFPSPELLDGASDEVLATIVVEDEYRAVVAGHRVVVGHVSSGTFLGAGCTDLAVQVREPRSRLLSLYRYWQAQSPAHLGTWGNWGVHVVGAAQLSLRAFLEAEVAWPATDNALTRQALGGMVSPYVDARAWAPTDADLARFLDHVSVAEWSTDSGRFIERIWERLGEPDPPVLDRVNVTEVHAAAQVIDRATLDALDRLVGLDRALLEAMAARGVLPPRTGARHDAEFEATAAHLGFTFA